MLSAMAEGGEKWKCETCMCVWGMDKIKCGACEALRPGLSDDEVAAIKAKEEKQKQDAINIFRQPASESKSSGFGGFGAGGFGGFGGAAPSTSTSMTFGFGVGSGGGASSAASGTPTVTFGFGNAATSSSSSGAGGLFGSAFSDPLSSPSGTLFGGATSSPSSAGFGPIGGSLFGASASGGSMFGVQSEGSSAASGGLFGPASSSSASGGQAGPFSVADALPQSGSAFTFGSSSGGAGTTTSPASAPSGPVTFGFGVAASAEPKPAAQASGAFVFGFGSPAPADATPAATAPPLFGAGGGGGFTPILTTAPVEKYKELAELPDFCRDGQVPVGDVFVHGSGECDQLGLGDAQRERQKPTVVKGLNGVRICDVAVGALHVICVACDGRLFSWGCNDDGALGRPSDADTDCEPHPLDMPAGVVVRKVTCGDCHSCALDTFGRVWLWGTYKDSNGHIGIARRRKREPVAEKSAEPAIVLEGCSHIASGTNHTVALVSGTTKKVFAWGSNGTGQLGLRSGAGCGLGEKEIHVPATGLPEGKLKERPDGTEVDGLRVVRIRQASGAETSAEKMKPPQVVQAVAKGARALLLELAEREVPKPEKKELLLPQEAFLGQVDGEITGVFASAECTFVTTAEGPSFGCGLNGDGQVGLGYASMAVKTFRPLPGATGASWLGGGLHTSAALIGGKVFTWGKAEECGHGLGAKADTIMQPRAISGLPLIRTLRCGGHHMLACSEAGDVFVWGCGLTHQLGNRPRDVSKPEDKDDDPEDELKPYRISSKQLETRFVLIADGGAQHSVELAWSSPKDYAEKPVATELFTPDEEEAVEVDEEGQKDGDVEEPPAKRRALAPESEGAAATAAVTGSQSELGEDGAASAAVAPTATEAETANVAAAQQDAAKLSVEAKLEVLRCFQGSLLSEECMELEGSAPADLPTTEPPTDESLRVLWSARKLADHVLSNESRQKLTGAPCSPKRMGPTPLEALTNTRQGASPGPGKEPASDLRLSAQLACLSRSRLEALLLAAARTDEGLMDTVQKAYDESASFA